MMRISIDSLNVYPVKSLAGVSVSETLATTAGLQFDRQWVIVDEKGVMQTQRKHPQMALIETRIDNGAVELRSGTERCLLPTALSSEAHSNPIEFSIWKDTCKGAVAPSELNHWITDAVKSTHPLRLVKTLPLLPRIAHQPQRFNTSFAGYADAAPYLIANTASLMRLNEHLSAAGVAPVDQRNFRANLWISGIPAFAEEKLGEMHVGTSQSSFKLIDQCSRCSMITVDPDTGSFRDQQTPFSLLAQLNAINDRPKVPAFGINSVLQGNPTVLSVGDTLQLSHT